MPWLGGDDGLVSSTTTTGLPHAQAPHNLIRLESFGYLVRNEITVHRITVYEMALETS